MTVEKKLELVKLLVESIEIPKRTNTTIWYYDPPRGQVKNTIRTARRLLQEISNEL